MKTKPTSKPSAPRPQKKEPDARDEKKSDASRELGGQPENDQDARAAGLESATSDSKQKKSPHAP